jgi:hypothetical protein
MYHIYQNIEINVENLPSYLTDGTNFDSDGALFYLRSDW